MSNWPRLCVSTSHYVAVCEGGRLLRTIHEGSGLYYGLTWDEEALWISARRALEHPFNRELVWRMTPRGSPLSCIPFPLAEVHQMQWEGDLYLTSVTFEQVLRIGELGYEVVHQGGANAHVNSIWVSRENVAWIVEHSMTSHTKVKSRVIRGDMDMGTAKVAHMGADVHNVFCDGMGVHVLSSLTGKLLRQRRFGVDEIEEVAVGEGLYLRGLAVTGDRIIVGGSHAGTRDFRHDHKTPGHLFLLDRKTLRTLDHVEIPNAGQIGEVRALEGDEAHNGIPFPGRV